MATEYKAEDVDVEDWISEGVSFLQAEVTLYRDPSMYAEYGPLMERIQILEKAIKPKKERKERSLDEESIGGEQQASFDDESLSDTTKSEVNEELEKLYARAAELHKAYTENSELWVLRRLNEDEVEDMKRELGDLPEQPVPIPNSSSKVSAAMKKRYVAEMVKFSQAMKEYADRLHTNLLPDAVMKVTVKGKVKVDTLNAPATKLTVNDIERLKRRPGGDAHFKELVEAMTNLLTEGVSIMAPHREGTGA